MDLTVDIQDIPVPPEYPVAEVHETETYYVNRRSVQLLNEVTNQDLTVEEFMDQMEKIHLAQTQAPKASSGEEKAEGDESIDKEAGEGSTEKVREGNDVTFSVVRPGHSDHPMVLNEDMFAIYFEQGEASLNHGAQATIATLPMEKCFRVAGYASPEGGQWMNWELSKDRAESVASEIETLGGVVLGIGAFGEFASEIWPEPWPVQRRVEIYVDKCED